MWMCRAVLKDGTVCETTNFDEAAQCSNCGAPRQANLDSHDHEGGEIGAALKNVAEIGKEKAKQYAPVAAAVAKTARARAGNFAMHSRLATHTGLHMASVFSFCAILLIASIALPVALKWPFTLLVSVRNDLHDAAGTSELQRQIEGSRIEARHMYDGSERVVEFVPRDVTDPRRKELLYSALLAGPVIISGTPVQLNGIGRGADGGQIKANVSLDLAHGGIFWLSALALLLVLIIADLLIGDIYAMQKLLFTLVLVWIGYCALLGAIAQTYMKGLVTQLFPDVAVELTMGGLMTAPIKISFIGLIYWMSSMILRSLYEERSAAAAERQRLAAEAES